MTQPRCVPPHGDHTGLSGYEPGRTRFSPGSSCELSATGCDKVPPHPRPGLVRPQPIGRDGDHSFLQTKNSSNPWLPQLFHVVDHFADAAQNVVFGEVHCIDRHAELGGNLVHRQVSFSV